VATSLTGVVAGIQVFESQRTNGRYLGDVLIEIGLLDAAILERDLTIERGRDAEDDGALNLRPCTVSGLTTVPQSTAQTESRQLHSSAA
jgi:hypothetical protein